jgi:hypothetical protein
VGHRNGILFYSILVRAAFSLSRRDKFSFYKLTLSYFISRYVSSTGSLGTHSETIMRIYLTSLLLAHPLGGCTLLVDAFAGTKMSSSLFSVPARTAEMTSSPALFAFENDDVQEEPRRKVAGKTRLAHEDKLSKTFATGDDLKNLRSDLDSLRQNLQWAEALKDETRIESLQKAITNGENRDPGWMYTKALKLMAQAKAMKDASQEEKDALSEKWTKIAASARECLPQFGLEGLWVGT